jgi:hypothetical protein
MQKERNRDCDMFLVHDDDLERIGGLVSLFSYQLDRSFHIRVCSCSSLCNPIY